MGLHVVVIFLRVIIVIMGAILAGRTFAHSRKIPFDKQSYFFLSIGFTLFTIGEIIEGILFEFHLINIISIHIIEGLLTSLGFIFTILSIKTYHGKLG